MPGDFRNQDNVGRAGDTGVQRDKARITPHYLEHHHAVMRLGGGVQPIDRLERGVDRSVEAERGDGAGHVVVDGLGHADDAHALGSQLRRDLERTVAANRDDCLDAEVAGILDEFVGTIDFFPRSVILLDRIREWAAAIGGPENRSASARDAAHPFRSEWNDFVFTKKAGIATLDAEYIPPACASRKDSRADYRVEARGITATGGKCDAHF